VKKSPAAVPDHDIDIHRHVGPSRPDLAKYRKALDKHELHG